ncbi:MAG: hypothetical protein H7Y22_07930 [Gemmatimonadaceae bacterium]|nr:hypothetical protein [Gloeobacterales cyanobacterium ES-bin-141]
MHSIQQKLHIGSDGLLQIHLPEARDTDIYVVIVYSVSLPKPVEALPLAQFYGCIQDETFTRHPQSEQSERELFE